MKMIAKKILPVMLSLMLVIGVMPFTAVTAYAATAKKRKENKTATTE